MGIGNERQEVQRIGRGRQEVGGDREGSGRKGLGNGRQEVGRIGTGKLEKGSREWKAGGRENRDREAGERDREWEAGGRENGDRAAGERE